MMPLDYQHVLAVVTRLVNGGPLEALPKKRSDQTVLLALASAGFASARFYREDDVNDRLRTWLASFASPQGLDHVTFRRQLVDERFLLRDAAGTAYRINFVKLEREIAESARAIDPGAVLVAVRTRRDERKRARAV
jgi:hypothetical protein